jgi:uncharacterized membrane-anchored protein
MKHSGLLLLAAVLCSASVSARNVTLTNEPRLVGRTLYIEGTTDLPDHAVIEWELRHELLFVRRDLPMHTMVTEGHTVVRGHRYAVAVDVSAWPAGSVEVWVAFQPRSYGTPQPAHISMLYGPSGEWIEGDKVSIHPAHMRRVELIQHVQLTR